MKILKITLSVILMLSLNSICTETNKEESMIEKAHTVVVVLEAKAGQEAALRDELLKVMALSRQEEGCLDYRVHEDNSNPAQFVLYENWKDAQVHQKQFEKPYILEFAQKAEGLLAKPYQVVLCKAL